MATADHASQSGVTDAGQAGGELPRFDRVTERVRRIAHRLTSPWVALAACAATIGAGFGIGLLMVYLPDPTPVQALERYQPSIQSTLYDGTDQPFDEWVIEKREIVRFNDIPTNLRHAVMAIEDARFLRHAGIDPIAVLRAVYRNLTRGIGSEGASTITMQLSRGLWLSTEKTFTRKAIEAFYYTLQTERYFSKERIFELYATQIFMGHNVYGLSAASQFHFGKPMQELSLAEAALLAGMIQRPSDYNPAIHPEEVVRERARRRRAVVLQRMVGEGYISAEEAEVAAGEPIVLFLGNPGDEVGAYFVEEIRKNLFEDYRGEIYESGLQIYTTLDRRLQAAAEYALEAGLRDIDKRQGWRGAQRHLPDEGIDPEDHHEADWDRPLRVGSWVPAVVVSVEPELAELRIGDRTATLTPEQAQWTRSFGLPDLSELIAPGDLISVRITALPEASEPTPASEPENPAAGGDDPTVAQTEAEAGGADATTSGDASPERGAVEAEPGPIEVGLDQVPEIQGAVLVVENVTGEVKAMVGGREFDRSEFNRAIQAKRQTGSAFKPFTYAAAMRDGYTASDLFLDEPKVFEDPATRQPYEPSNYEDHYIGITTFLEALAKSRNVVTVAIQEEIGADRVIDLARQLGITADLQPYLSLSLGTIDASLWEMVRAYAVFPNGGVRVEPHLVREIRDRYGRTLHRTERQSEAVMDNDIAYLITRMLVNVVEYCKDNRLNSCIEGGTGRRARPLARDLGMALGGKTGTTDDYSDAWFVGFSPYHTIGVWVGNDTKKPIGPREEGARAALPIWQEVMRAASQGLEPKNFERPANVVLRTIDPRTGMLASGVCTTTIEMAFVDGTEPTAVCSDEEHGYLALEPHYQAYFLDRLREKNPTDRSRRERILREQ